MKESANDKRVTLIQVILNLTDDETSSAFVGTTDGPDAAIKHHGGSHPGDPPPPPPGEGQ